ncbi:MAG: Protein-disulfide isomerase-like protein [Candidatus Saccharibacteria bacterium GW2011_GWC2_48_9]|nr:MAG: Protein-disulfide isomerase-like protein [Candidatus Saccharibacteria bacterium GW2011_GWC2_48_9]
MDTKRWLIFIAGVALLLAGIVAYDRAKDAGLPKSNGSSNIYGNKDSRVTLTEFVDFQCEACYSYYPVVKELKEKYKDRVKFQIRYFPISNSLKYARQAAAYAEAAARQGKFFEMHDKLFEGQKTWENSSDAASEYFDEYAKEIGLDLKKVKDDLDNPVVAATINADLEAVKKLGGNGTPTFVLNGKKIDNPESTVSAFSRILDNELPQQIDVE